MLRIIFLASVFLALPAWTWAQESGAARTRPDLLGVVPVAPAVDKQRLRALLTLPPVGFAPRIGFSFDHRRHFGNIAGHIEDLKKAMRGDLDDADRLSELAYFYG